MATTIVGTLSQHGSLSISWVLTAGAAGGLVDMLYFSTTTIVEGGSVINVFRSVGRFWPVGGFDRHGFPLAVVGVFTHFGLAVIMAAGFALLLPTLLSVLKSPWLAGAFYGFILYVIMYLVVMPLRWPAIYPRFDGTSSILDILVHVAVGLTFAAVLAKSRLFLPSAS